MALGNFDKGVVYRFLQEVHIYIYEKWFWEQEIYTEFLLKLYTFINTWSLYFLKYSVLFNIVWQVCLKHSIHYQNEDKYI